MISYHGETLPRLHQDQATVEMMAKQQSLNGTSPRVSMRLVPLCLALQGTQAV